MSAWRSGSFDRSRLADVWHPFVPAQSADNLHTIDLKALWSAGKRLILVDVDNTMVQWRGEDFSKEVVGWIQEAKTLGFEICIISNTNRVERLARIRELLGVESVRGRFKPSRSMFRLALIKFRRRSEEAIMIGDQLMTDVFGANRAGIDAIWVRKMEGREFGPTSLNRFVERLLTGPIYRALVLPEDHAPVVGDKPTTSELTIVQQIVRFVIVGASSFVIDTAITYLLMRWIRLDGRPLGFVAGSWLIDTLPSVFSFASNPDKAAAPIFGGAASFLAMVNSFVWNRSWTFEARGKDRRSAQVVRFYAVSVSGALLNAALFSAVYNVLPSDRRASIVIAKVIAAGCVAIWNFLGQRYFAFRARTR